MTALFPPLYTALASNLPPPDLRAFLRFCEERIAGDVRDLDFWDEPFAPGELPEELPSDYDPDLDDGDGSDGDDFDPTPDCPVTGEPFLLSPDVPEISKDSETPEVAAWCRAVGLNASVVGQWVWCDPHAQPGHDRASLELVLRAAGFQFARRRQSFFHACTVNSRRQPGDKRRGGKLERFHGACAAADYSAGKDMRPAWQLAKAAKAKARRKK